MTSSAMLLSITASCSGIHQSSDVSPLFQVIKTKIHAVETRKYRSPLINTALLTILASCGFSAAMRSKISDGLQKVVSTIRAVMTAEMIVAGYEKTGQFPVDFAVTMRQSTYTFTLLEWATMTANLDAAADRFCLAGELTEAEMNDLQIPSVAESQRNKKPKDQRLLHHFSTSTSRSGRTNPNSNGVRRQPSAATTPRFRSPQNFLCRLLRSCIVY